MDEDNRIAQLLLRRLRGDLSQDERRELEIWLGASPENQAFADRLSPPALRLEKLRLLEEMDDERIHEKVSHRIGWDIRAPVKRRRIPRWLKIAAAILIFVGVWRLRRSGQHEHDPPVKLATMLPLSLEDYAVWHAPTQYAALLELSDQRKVLMDSLPRAATLVSFPESSMIEKNGTTLNYCANTGSANKQAENRLLTRRSNDWVVVLEDGTRVTLADHSSIKYRISFDGKQREVELRGKAFFAIASHKDAPFIVNGKRFNVKARGTTFQVSNYEDQGTAQIALFNGVVVVNRGKDSTQLQPGDLADIRNHAVSVTRFKDSARLLAWKNLDVFSFDETPMEDAIREIARWYEVTPCFLTHVEGTPLTGFIRRNLSPEEVVSQLERMQNPKGAYQFSMSKGKDSLIISSADAAIK